MKKRLLSLLLAMLLAMGMFNAISVSAHQGIDISTDFNDYVGTWDGTAVTTGGSMPTAKGGTFATYSTQTAVNGTTSGVAKDDKYGTSLKVYQWYDPDGSNLYGGAKYTFSTKPENSYYMEVSINTESTADGKYNSRSMRMQSSKGTILPILFDGTYISTFGTSTGVVWEKDVWYDFKIWMNSNTGVYTTQVWSDGELLSTVTNTYSSLANISPVQRIEFFHNPHTANANSWTYKDSEGNTKVKDPQITYYDNFEFRTIYKYEIDETKSSSHTVLDFETIDTTSKTTIGKYMNDKGGFSYGYQGAGEGMDLESVTTNRGKGVRIVPWVIPADSDKYTYSTSDGIVYDKETGTQLYARSRMLYNSIYYTRNASNYIKDTMYFKTGVKFEDTNFGQFHISISSNYYTEVVFVRPNGEFSVMGKASGIKFAIDRWYDIEGYLDADTGYYIVSLTDETGSKFETSGFKSAIDISSNGTYPGNYRLSLNYYDRSSKNNWSIPTSMIVDHMQLGPVTKLKAPISKIFTFADSDEASSFAVSGGSSAVESEALKISGAADDTTETTASMKMPFVNTTFKYSADINLADLSADRTLKLEKHVSTNSNVRTTAPVEVAKFTTDGKLIIGDAEIADVTVTDGAYHVDVIFNQGAYTATVTVSKDGETVAQASAALGTAAVKIITVDWVVGAGSATVTTLDNVSYSTIYNFEIDEKFSTTGENKIVEAGSDVVAKFTNPIDRSTFTSDTISVNTNAAINEISFEDDYTVKLGFEKDQGTHYYVRFMGVADIYGNTTTDYIEFDTVYQDLVMTAPTFKRNGEALSLSTAGDVTATFTAKANNGKTFDMFYAVGLYEGGELVKAVCDDFTVGDAKEEHSLKITVPDDGKYYVLKAFIWDSNNNSPYKKTEILKPIPNQPIALVKLDDMTSKEGDLLAFERALAFAEENNIKMNFGLITQYLDNPGNAESRARILNFYNHPLIELWSHAYSWSIKLGNATDEEQAEDFRLAHETAAKYGITYKTFSAPSGSINAYTREMLNKYNFKVLSTTTQSEADLTEWGMFDSSNTFTTLHQKRFNLEPEATGNTRDVETLKEMWKTACENGDKFEILQVHPNGWGGYEGSEQRFYDFLLWLKDQGVVFMTFEEYANYSSMIQ